MSSPRDVKLHACSTAIGRAIEQLGMVINELGDSQGVNALHIMLHRAQCDAITPFDLVLGTDRYEVRVAKGENLIEAVFTTLLEADLLPRARTFRLDVRPRAPLP